ncbi:MAG: LPS assembly lipoprotein LptE [Chthoniobacterales bacterium]
MKKLVAFLALISISFSLSGCGYTLGEIKPTTMRRVNTISVGTFKNDTLIPRLEAQTADAVAKQFQQDGTYRIETPDRADANLGGTIVSVKRQPMRVYASNVMQTSEFELIIIVDFAVKDRLTGALLLKGRVEGHVPFFINSDNVNSDLVTDQNINYPIAAQRAAEAIVSRVSEGW